MIRSLTVLISTHDRAALLERTLRYLNEARRPRDWDVRLLVVANACSDGTHDLLQKYLEPVAKPAASPLVDPLPLQWVAEPMPGKSHALNRALPLLTADLAAFVDDDHRVDAAYLENACAAFQAYPNVDIFCGRIIPDWDGSEPAWVHDDGPFRIYPLPVPRYDLGDLPLASPQDQATPGGGNLILRSKILARVGKFSTAYGPVGRDLGGAEDKEWVWRAIASGARIQYVPDIVQYHYVDPARLTLGYVLRKAFERSASAIRLSTEASDSGFIPRYMIRKVAQYLLMAMLSPSGQRRRFHLVRMSASLGEIKGSHQARRDRRDRSVGIPDKS